MTRGSIVTFRASFRALSLGGVFLICLTLGTTDSGAWGLRAAAAAEPADVEALIRQGVQLRTQGKDQAAMPLFQKAYEIERSPRTAAQLGLAEASLGYWLAAERHLTEALSSTRHPWVSRMRPQLEATLKNVSSAIGEIEVAGSPSGAEVLFNGKVVGTVPMRAVRIAEGVAQVMVRNPGHIDHNVSVMVTGGKRESLVVALAPGNGSVGPAPPLATNTADLGSGNADGRDLSPPDARDGDGSLQVRNDATKPGAPAWVRPASWVTAGLALTALGIGGYELLQMRSHEKLFNQHKNIMGMPDCFTTAPRRGGSECEKLYNKTTSAERWGIGGVQVGGVLAVAAIIGFVWSSNSGSSESAALPGNLAGGADVAIGVDPGGASAALSWRF